MMANRALPRFAAVGAGRMGRGIAIAFAYAGHRISLIDLRQRSSVAWDQLRGAAQAEIEASLSGLAQLGVIDPALVPAIAARVEFVNVAEAPAALHTAELVFEGVPERLASVAKATANDVLHLVSREVIQLHGGIGMTDEYDIGFYIKRARVLENAWGSSSFHRNRFAQLGGY